MSKQIAVIGSGIAGISSAYYLDKLSDHQVTVFEADFRIGGHVNTIEVDGVDSALPIDTGFIVFNDRTYPNFKRLLGELKVEYQHSQMSFSVINPKLKLEYNGHNLNSLFSQRRNLLRPKFWRLVKDILRFNKQVTELGKQADFESKYQNVTLADFLTEQGYSEWFEANYLIPMVAAIWSMGLSEAKDFPLVFFSKFFNNHGLLQIKDRPQWFTISGGSKTYIEQILKVTGAHVFKNTPVTAVKRSVDHVELSVQTSQGVQTHQFDEVIFACHADTALSLLKDPSANETEVLSGFAFTPNTAVLHTDTSVLPKYELSWASWNYRITGDGSKPLLTYHMNILQSIPSKTNYLVSLNQTIDPKHVIKTIEYDHPVYNSQMLKAQKQHALISGVDRVHFAGAYWFNGFHEDGLRSAIRVCQALGAPIEDLMDAGA
jgi:predicted NAD/FAD-binding protein